jgi:hypothetical protein
MIIAGILCAEVAFWVLLIIALGCRYLLRRRRLSTVLLLLLPVVDLTLLAFVVADLLTGATPTQQHALAATYLGFTVAFGHPLVRWLDARFAHRFGGRPAPTRPAKGSTRYVRGLWIEWLRVLAGAAIAVLVLAFLSVGVRGDRLPQSLDQAATNPFWAQSITLGMVVIIWFLAGPAFARPTDRR